MRRFEINLIRISWYSHKPDVQEDIRKWFVSKGNPGLREIKSSPDVEPMVSHLKEYKYGP